MLYCLQQGVPGADHFPWMWKNGKVEHLPSPQQAAELQTSMEVEGVLKKKNQTQAMLLITHPCKVMLFFLETLVYLKDKFLFQLSK